MYDISRTSYGLRITLGEPFTEEDADAGIQELEKLVPKLPSPCSMLADTQSLGALEEYVRLEFVKALHLLKRHGLDRLVLVPSPAQLYRAQRILDQSGLNDRALLVDTSENPDWETEAGKWLTSGES